MSDRDSGRDTPRHEHVSPALRLARLVLTLAEHDDVGLSHDDLLHMPFYAELRDAQQALHQDLRGLCALPLRLAQAGHEVPPDALARFDTATRHYHLARPLHMLHLNPAALGALRALLDELKGGTTLPGGADLIGHMLTLIPPEQRDGLEAGGTSAGMALELGLAVLSDGEQRVAQKLLQAYSERRTVELVYHPLYKRETTWHKGDEVLGISIGTHAYVTLWCDDRQREVELRLNRIEPDTLKLLPKTASRRERRGVVVRYRLSPYLAESAYSAHLENQHADVQPDGSVIVSGLARSLFWAQKLLLGYGVHARALDPPALVTRMRETIDRMRLAYDDAASEQAEKKDTP